MISDDKLLVKRGGRGVRGGNGFFKPGISPRFRSLRGKLPGKDRQSGFALIITIVLLALLVLVVYALSALSRVGADIAASDVYQAQARQHALLGLSQAVGGLQRDAASDDVITGMAGITGITEGAGQSARHWCGVWDAGGQFKRWLVSGESGQGVPALNDSEAIALVASGSLGTEGSDREYVRVLAVPVMVGTPDNPAAKLGSYAWWVGDEGVKLSAVLPDGKHAIDELVSLPSESPELPATVSYEQISLVPAPVSTAVLAGQLRANFHVLGRTHLSGGSNPPAPGLLNVNSTAIRYWRGVAATYNHLKPASAPAIGAPGFAAWMHDHLTMADPGATKALNRPYLSVDFFLNSTALSGALNQNSTALQKFGDVMRPWLAVRSDTFRVRAYGDAVNPSDPAKVESVAWCEAIVQRVKDTPASTQGRFIITYFRWLSPDDI
jgi:hypothetical protein